MAKAVITIYQYDSDPNFKSMIQELMNNKDESNPYRRIKSESDLVKMLLEKVLPQEHKKYCHHPASKPKSRKTAQAQENSQETQT